MFKVIQVVPTKDFTVYIYFSDGKIKIFDANELKNKGVFKVLQDIDFFMNRCTVLNDTLAWDLTGNYDPENCLDLDPENLYKMCAQVFEENITTA